MSSACTLSIISSLAPYLYLDGIRISCIFRDMSVCVRVCDCVVVVVCVYVCVCMCGEKEREGGREMAIFNVYTRSDFTFHETAV